MRIGDKVYIAKRIYAKNAQTPTYEKPCFIYIRPNYFTVMPASRKGYLMMMQYGEDVNKMWVANANVNYFSGKFKEGDLLWVDGEEPDAELETMYGFGSTANAVIKTVSEGNFVIEIVLASNDNKVCK